MCPNVNSVSYTHLDVYKRQEHISVESSCEKVLDSWLGHKTVCDCARVCAACVILVGDASFSLNMFSLKLFKDVYESYNLNKYLYMKHTQTVKYKSINLNKYTHARASILSNILQISRSRLYLKQSNFEKYR